MLHATSDVPTSLEREIMRNAKRLILQIGLAAAVALTTVSVGSVAYADKHHKKFFKQQEKAFKKQEKAYRKYEKERNKFVRKQIKREEKAYREPYRPPRRDYGYYYPDYYDYGY
ncbi:hypothetical protein GCM10007094_37540 [Pseudovibrio japonicus]|uniref:Uncharacterized protein n=2 Tax=Pseudovibrio japonicus TaxID=366534 RepID=A0ABQ3EMQ3_9HYPH|nr:hypothetical protein GCM10007094_37540 [Pseudovibrio japonicus]